MYELWGVDVHKCAAKATRVVSVSHDLDLSLNPLWMVPIVVVPLCQEGSRSGIQGYIAQPTKHVVSFGRKLNIGKFILRHDPKSGAQILLAIVYND